MISILRANRIYFLLFFMMIAFCTVILMMYTKSELFFSVNSIVNPNDQFFKYLTHIGDGLFFCLIIVILAFIKFRYAIIGLLCYAIPSLFTQFLKKNIFHELRPKAFYEGLQNLTLVNGVEVHSLNSFPSGHTTSVFAMFAFLAIITPNKNYGFLYFILALFVGFSRIYLSQHFLFDVYMGSIIGTLGTLFIFYFVERYDWFGKGIFQGRVGKVKEI